MKYFSSFVKGREEIQGRGREGLERRGVKGGEGGSSKPNLCKYGVT